MRVLKVIRVQLGNLNFVLIALKLGLFLLGMSLTMMSIAFMAGIYVVVRDLYWLAQGVAVMEASFLVTVLASSILSNIFCLWYISYYPFHLLMYLTSSGNSRI